MLILQIALGILLAGFLYRYWRKIGAVVALSIAVIAFAIALYAWGWAVLWFVMVASFVVGVVQRIRAQRRRLVS